MVRHALNEMQHRHIMIMDQDDAGARPGRAQFGYILERLDMNVAAGKGMANRCAPPAVIVDEDEIGRAYHVRHRSVASIMILKQVTAIARFSAAVLGRMQPFPDYPAVSLGTLDTEMG